MFFIFPPKMTTAGRLIEYRYSPFNICTFNARSIRNKLVEISHFVELKNIQIFAVSETWLRPGITDNSISIPDFQTVFRKDRNKMGEESADMFPTKYPTPVVMI